MLKQCAITTFDNPFNPFEQFKEWFQFDVEKGYNSCGKLDRIAKYTDEMSETEYLMETERAINRIIELDFTDTYTIIYKDLNPVDDEDD